MLRFIHLAAIFSIISTISIYPQTEQSRDSSDLVPPQPRWGIFEYTNGTSALPGFNISINWDENERLQYLTCELTKEGEAFKSAPFELVNGGEGVEIKIYTVLQAGGSKREHISISKCNSNPLPKTTDVFINPASAGNFDAKISPINPIDNFPAIVGINDARDAQVTDPRAGGYVAGSWSGTTFRLHRYEDNGSHYLRISCSTDGTVSGSLCFSSFGINCWGRFFNKCHGTCSTN